MVQWVPVTKILQSHCEWSLQHWMWLRCKCTPRKLCGANIFNIYCSPLGEVIPPNIQLSGFADDHSVCKIFKANNRESGKDTMAQLEDCMLKIKLWMDKTRLKMNPSKQFIYFGSCKQLAKCTLDTINVAGDLILRSQLIRYLGVWMDSELSFKYHVTKKCQCAMINFKRIQSIWNLLNNKTTVHLWLSLCVSHLDYCNSVLYGLPVLSDSEQATKNPEYVCTLNLKKEHLWQYNRLFTNTTLTANQTEDCL